MKKYRVLYWSAGRKEKVEVEVKTTANTIKEVKLLIYLFYQCDDIISIEEVTENV